MQVTVLGAGLMGLPVAARLAASGFDVVLWNRTAANVALQPGSGVRFEASLVSALQQAEVVILLLADAAAITEVLFSDPNTPLRSRILIQMGTIAPDESRDFAVRAAAAGAQWLEAPVLGSIPEARSGTLLLMVGASAEQFSTWLPVFERLGHEVRHIGEVGTAAALKLAMNQLIAGLTATFSLSLAMLRGNGVAVEDFMQITRASALYAPTFDKKLPKMLANDFANPNFPLKHLEKDVSLFLRAAAPLQLDARALEGAHAILLDALAAGEGDLDYSAICRAISPSLRA